MYICPITAASTVQQATTYVNGAGSIYNAFLGMGDFLDARLVVNCVQKAHGIMWGLTGMFGY